MEIAHNVLHGQWDWMRDPEIQSATWEWDHACPSAQWKHSHNVVHHKWTNVLGRDRDVGYGMLRVSAEQRWSPFYLLQPLSSVLMALFFEAFIAMHDLEINRLLKGKKDRGEARRQWREIRAKAGRQALKDYVLFPLLAGPFFLYVAAANLVASLLRNVWTFVIIFCGHFPSGVYVFTPEQVDGESRGQWYLRQVLGSCNIGGGALFHVLSGNLSHQIEHHLFPDMPSNRYPEVAPRIRALCARYGVPYNSGSLTRQFGTTMLKIVRFTLPSATHRGRPGAQGERQRQRDAEEDDLHRRDAEARRSLRLRVSAVTLFFRIRGVVLVRRGVQEPRPGRGALVQSCAPFSSSVLTKQDCRHLNRACGSTACRQ